MPHGRSQKSRRRVNRLLLAAPLLALASISPFAAAQNAPAASRSDDAPAQRRPNILIIVADDLGYQDVGFNGAATPTPNIDRIARSGMVLDHFYASALCSPSRAGLLTGRYPHRYGIMGDTITPGSDFGLDPQEQTIAQLLGNAGYSRRAFLGKWHLGHRAPAFHPMRFGFTSFYGHYNGAIDYFTHAREGEVDWHRDRTPSGDQGYSTDLLSDEAVRLIRTPAKQDGSPWMMWLAYNAPHGPLQATEQDLAAVGFDPAKPRFGEERANAREGGRYGIMGYGNTRRQTTLAMIHGMDRGIGRILDALAQTGQLDNTLILFTSDNGGPRGAADNGPLRGWKFLHYEGGVRVAAAMSWPAGLKPRARADIGDVSYVDILPTVARLAGTHSERTLDGRDVSDALLSGKPLGDRTLFMGEDYRVAAAEGERGPTDPEALRGRAAAAIDGKWKLVGGELYDLDADPYEKQDVAAQHPDIVARIEKRVADYVALRRVPRTRMNATHLPPLPLWELPAK
jgi:arylsulfatase B